MSYKKVGSLDGYALVRNSDGVLYKVIPGEIESLDLWSEPLDCLLFVDFDNDTAQDVSIAGMHRDDLPDGFDFEFRGKKGEEYSGQLGWGGGI